TLLRCRAALLRQRILRRRHTALLIGRCCARLLGRRLLRCAALLRNRRLSLLLRRCLTLLLRHRCLLLPGRTLTLALRTLLLRCRALPGRTLLLRQSACPLAWGLRRRTLLTAPCLCAALIACRLPACGAPLLLGCLTQRLGGLVQLFGRAPQRLRGL